MLKFVPAFGRHRAWLEPRRLTKTLYADMIPVNRMIQDHSDDLTIWLNPKYIDYRVGPNIRKFPNSSNWWIKAARSIHDRAPPSIKKYSPLRMRTFCIPDKHYARPVSVPDLYKYKKIRSLFDNRKEYTNSIWYQDLLRSLETKGIVRHKNILIESESQLHVFFQDYALGLIDSMQSEGYIYDKSEQIGNVIIGPKGEIHKSNAGDHRFITAKIVGVESMPFIVKGIHCRFLMRKRIPCRPEFIPQIIEAIRNLSETYQ